MKIEHTIESKPPVPILAEAEHESSQPTEEEIRAFARRVFEFYEETMSQNDRLSALYQVDTELFEEEVDEAVDDYLDEDPSFKNLMEEFRKARKNGSGDSYIPEIKARHNSARELILNTLNLPENSEVLGVEASKNNIEDILKEIPKEPQNLDLALSTLGAKVKVDNEPGEYVYSYPYDLLPEKINNKWADYLESVKAQISATKNVTPETANDVIQIDFARKLAHDNVTKAVHSILQLDQFGATEKQTRNLLARMRNDELMLARKQHSSVHHKTPEEIAVANQLSRRSYHH